MTIFFLNKNTALLLVIASFLIASCGRKNEKKDKEKPPVEVDVLVTTPEALSDTIEVNGTVLAEDMVEIRPEVSGRLVFLSIPEGEKVSKGTVLARINDAELQAQLEQQKSQLDLAQKNENRMKELLSANSVNQSDYDIALNQLRNTEAAIKITQAQLDKTVIKAPFDGELGLRMVSSGAYVSPQTLITTLHNKDQVKIDFTVPQRYAFLAKKGKTVVLSEGNDKPLSTAVIMAVEPQIDTKTRNLKLRARLTEGQLMPGGFVKVMLTEQREGFMVPSEALIPNAASNQLVIIDKGQAVFRNVETGIRTGSRVEVTGGISAGDSIVVTGVLFVRPQAKVKVRSVKNTKG